MKILTLSLKNINALQGEWHIDLGRRGLFAIVGDTGAGKTTILDAICLALYGRTPRLKTISANQNELMHKSAGEMAAEVVVLVANKRYLFRFFQRRARGRADGKLQNIEHTISYEKEGAFCPYVLAKTAVEKKTQAILGMDFEQFTRSVLLAQGDFAQFLHSDAASRGAMLENITDSGIYRRIGIYVYNEHKTQETKLKQQQKALDDLTNKENTRSLEEVRTQLLEEQNKQNKLNAQQKTYKDKRQALIDYQGYLQQKNALNQQLLDAEKALEHFADDEKRLVRHKRCAWVNADFTEWQTNRQDINHLLRQIHDNQAKQKKLTDDITKNKKQLAETKTRLAAQQRHADDTLPNLTKALDIDQQLDRQQNNLDHYQRQHGELTEDIRQSKERHAKLQDKLAALDTILAQQKKLLDNPKQRTINAQLENITAQCVLIKDTKQGYHLNLNEVQQIQKNIENIENRLIDTHHKIAMLEDARARKQSALDDSEQTFLLLCQNGDYTNTYQQGQKTLTALENIHNTAQKCHQKQTELANNAQSLEVLENELKEQLKLQKNAQSEFDIAEHHHSLAEETILLRQRLAQLQDKEPCPLCGATSHPYKYQTFDDNLSPLSERLAQARRKLTEADKKTQALQDELQKQTWADDMIKKDLQREWQLLSDDWAAFTGVHALPAMDFEWLAHDIFVALSEQREWLDHLTKSYNKYLKDKDALDYDVRELQKLTNESQTDHNTVNSEMKRQSYHEQLLADQKKILSDAYAQLQNSPIPPNVLPATCPWQSNMFIPDNYLDDLRSFCKEAKSSQTTYDETFRANIETQSEQENKLKALDEQAQHLTTLEKKLNDTNSDITNTERHIANLTQKRRELINDDQDPQRAIDDINRKVSDLKEQFASCNGKQDELEKQQQELTKTLKKAGDEQQALEHKSKQLKQNLDNTLSAQGFTDSDDYLSALLTPDVADELSKTHNALLENKKSLSTTLALLQKNIAALMERYSDLDTLTLAPIEADIARQEADIQALNETITDLVAEQKILSQHQERAKQLTDTIAKQQKVLEPLRLLNDLIGSADGKKFSHHIQELHLTQLLAYANHQLQAMGDRYALIPSMDDKNKLGIDIIDHYQQCTRSSHNLSGGEQFIVSLALALGLSQFSSQNNPIDSLFLDEGFGTLDDNHLAQALATLAELELSGKTIGVISHMPSLKEQIGQKIVITKKGGGVSTISGEGVVAKT